MICPTTTKYQVASSNTQCRKKVPPVAASYTRSKIPSPSRSASKPSKGCELEVPRNIYNWPVPFSSRDIEGIFQITFYFRLPSLVLYSETGCIKSPTKPPTKLFHLRIHSILRTLFEGLRSCRRDTQAKRIPTTIELQNPSLVHSRHRTPQWRRSAVRSKPPETTISFAAVSFFEQLLKRLWQLWLLQARDAMKQILLHIEL